MVSLLNRAGAAMGGGAHGRGIALALVQGMVAKSSFVNAIDDVFIVTAAFTLIALVPALFLRKGTNSRSGGPAMAE